MNVDLTRSQIARLTAGKRAKLVPGQPCQRKFQVLELVALGLPQVEIGKRLHISPKTVGGYMTRLREDLMCDNSTAVEMLFKAAARGWVKLPGLEAPADVRVLASLTVGELRIVIREELHRVDGR